MHLLRYDYLLVLITYFGPITLYTRTRDSPKGQLFRLHGWAASSLIKYINHCFDLITQFCPMFTVKLPKGANELRVLHTTSPNKTLPEPASSWGAVHYLCPCTVKTQLQYSWVFLSRCQAAILNLIGDKGRYILTAKNTLFRRSETDDLRAVKRFQFTTQESGWDPVQCFVKIATSFLWK